MSEAFQNARTMPGFLHCVKASRNDFSAIFTQKNSHNSVQNDHKGKKFKTCFEDYLEGFPKIPAQTKVSFIVSPGVNF